MKNIITIIIISASAGLAFSQTGLGVDKATTPSQKLDINGWLEVGNESAPGTGSAGTIRYNTTEKSVQFHNGSAWVNVGSTVKFTNWGRPDCPASAALVYTGTVGGGSHDQVGSGYQTLCLSRTPNFVGFNDGNHNGALIYGQEFETSGYGVATLAALHDRKGECAVCLASARVLLMVPGSTACPSGWTQQYWGYIMSTHYSQSRSSEWVCVNNSPTNFGIAGNNNGNLWYPTELEICSLRAPYVANRELVCSVCTK